MPEKNNNNQQDLTGQKFGKLTVISRAESIGKRAAWLCECECGSRRIVKAEHLKSGNTRSCGCMRKSGHPGKDIAGQKFGRLTALYPTEKRSSDKSVVWMCQCGCGNTAEVGLSDLETGKVVSCGCRKKENDAQLFSRLNRVDGTCIEWLANRKHRSDNTSGFRGVWKLDNGTYRVGIGFKNKKYFLGNYANYGDAVEMRQYAESVIHDGFVQSRARWEAGDRKNPFLFEVIRTQGKLEIESSDPESDGQVIYVGEIIGKRNQSISNHRYSSETGRRKTSRRTVYGSVSAQTE